MVISSIRFQSDIIKHAGYLQNIKLKYTRLVTSMKTISTTYTSMYNYLKSENGLKGCTTLASVVLKCTPVTIVNTFLICFESALIL